MRAKRKEETSSDDESSSNDERFEKGVAYSYAIDKGVAYSYAIDSFSSPSGLEHAGTLFTFSYGESSINKFRISSDE
jgi:hypothetical protein